MLGGGGLCDDKRQLVWVGLSRWETFGSSDWVGKVIAFHAAWRRGFTTGTLETGRRGHHSTLCSEKTRSERPKRKHLQRTAGPAAGGWNEAAGNEKEPLCHSCLKTWMAAACSLSERIEKYRLTESLRLNLHPYNLRESIASVTS